MLQLTMGHMGFNDDRSYRTFDDSGSDDGEAAAAIVVVVVVVVPWLLSSW